MGSGETAPSLVGVHRELLANLDSPRCIWLDTPYGFQENADVLSAKTVEFFQQSLGHSLKVAQFRHCEQAEVERQLAYRALRAANYLFAGPGSPSYALRHWSKSEVPTIFLEKLRDEASVVVLASAAACAVGALCLPVYEIYKVGQEPHWLPGLDILPALGFRALVLPHYNNTVGGNHDTRYCYLGERRLSLLEATLESDLWIWGVDEHTALTLDLQNGWFEVAGKGGFTLRQRGESEFFPAGTRGALEQLQQPRSIRSGLTGVSAPPSGEARCEVTQGLITQQVEPLAAGFHHSLLAGEGLRATQYLLDIEQVLQEWSGDSDAHHRELARGLFRSLLAQLGEAAQRGLQSPTSLLKPLVEFLLEVRREARAERQFQLADRIREQLAQAGVEVQDTPTGARWSLRDEVSLV